MDMLRSSGEPSLYMDGDHSCEPPSLLLQRRSSSNNKSPCQLVVVQGERGLRIHAENSYMRRATYTAIFYGSDAKTQAETPRVLRFQGTHRHRYEATAFFFGPLYVHSFILDSTPVYCT